MEEAAGCDAETAGRLLEEAGSVKVAIVMGKLGVERGEAEDRLAVAGGRLREALRSC